MKQFSLFLLLALATPAWAQPLSLTLKGDVKVVKVDRVIVVKEDRTVVSSFPLCVQAPKTDGGLFFWNFPSNVSAQDKGESLEVTAAPNGDCTISVKVVTPLLDKDGKFKGFMTTFATVTFSVGGVTPPIPPKPPDPPVPVPVAGLRVLMIYESAQGVPKAATNADVRAYLESKCLLGSDGVKDYRIWDKDVNASGIWAVAIKRPRASVPWIIINDGKATFDAPLYEGPLGSVAETLALLRKYGG